jgi:predicted TIM-barrel fold metal-dependent hydrolase
MGFTPIISVDGHVKASVTTYRDYIEAKHVDAFDDWVQSAAATTGRDAGNIQLGLGDEAQWDVSRRLTDLESQGVVAEVLFPNGVPFQANQFEDAGEAFDPELTRAGKMAYNRWLADFCSQAPGRLSGQAMVLFDDVDQAVKDVQWAKEHGLGGIMMPALYPGGTYFFDPALDPIWAAIAETGLPISQHGGTGAPTYTPAGMAAILTLAFEHAFFSGRSLWQMIVGGVFDRFPDLKMVFVETEVHWIGPALQHFDQRVKLGDDWTEFAAYLNRERAFSRLPSEYWTSNCYAGISPFHPAQLPLSKLGSGYELEPDEFAIRSHNSMFGVDYPHFESIYPRTLEQVTGLVNETSMTLDDTQGVLFRNAARVYGFNIDELQPITDRVGIDVDGIRRSLAETK